LICLQLLIACVFSLLPVAAGAMSNCDAPEPWTLQGSLYLDDKTQPPHIVFSSPYTSDFSRYFFTKDSKVGKKILSVCNAQDSCWIKGKVCTREDATPRDTSWAAWIVSIDQIKRKPENVLVEEFMGWTHCEKQSCHIDEFGPDQQTLRERKEVIARYKFNANSKVGKKILQRCKSGQACRMEADVDWLNGADPDPGLNEYAPMFNIIDASKINRIMLGK
jgi:hypothetical protein